MHLSTYHPPPLAARDYPNLNITVQYMALLTCLQYSYHNFLTFVKRTAIAYLPQKKQNPKALADFLPCPYAIVVVFIKVRKLRVGWLRLFTNLLV